MRNIGWRVLLIIIVVGFFAYSLYPPEKKINLGLDLKGGIFLTLEVDVDTLKEYKPNITEKEIIETVDRALEIIRARVDALGIAEPVVVREGLNRIVVELPGVKDPERAKKIIGKTAQLEFRLVNDNIKYVDEKTPLPEGYEALDLLKKDETGEYHSIGKLVVRKKPELTGEYLEKVGIRYDSLGRPYVTLKFNDKGAKIFANVTTRYYKKRLAIVLDGKIMSAPVINARIPDGRAIIEGNFTLQEAKDLKIVLEAGALPAPISIIADRTIGPTLGLDSIKKGVKASILGLVLVILFMFVYYRFSGFVADFALLLNLILLLGALSALGGTLTLPGIAGIILTIGMSVDANVIVFERIKEELKNKKSIRNAIDFGYKRAFITILDANLTTIITAFVLYQFGTGPIRGFAVTLMLGIVASMFTALFVTRTIFAIILSNPEVKKISI